MALGQNYSNYEGSRDNNRPTVYGYQFVNDDDSAVDRTAIGFHMWAGTIKISIAPRVKDTANDRMVTNYEAGDYIWLTTSKAKIFADVIKKFLNNINEKDNPYNGWAVYTKQGMIGIFSGDSVGASSPCIILKKVNASNGAVDSEYAYQIKTSYEAISDFDEKNPSDFVRHEDYPYIELEMIIDQLDDYARFASKAIAFHTVDALSSTLNMFHENMTRIGQNMGVQMVLPRGQSSQVPSKSYFDRPKQTGTTSDITRKSSTIEDILNA